MTRKVVADALVAVGDVASILASASSIEPAVVSNPRGENDIAPATEPFVVVSSLPPSGRTARVAGPAARSGTPVAEAPVASMDPTSDVTATTRASAPCSDASGWEGRWKIHGRADSGVGISKRGATGVRAIATNTGDLPMRVRGKVAPHVTTRLTETPAEVSPC